MGKNFPPMHAYTHTSLSRLFYKSLDKEQQFPSLSNLRHIPICFAINQMAKHEQCSCSMENAKCFILKGPQIKSPSTNSKMATQLCENKATSKPRFRGTNSTTSKKKERK